MSDELLVRSHSGVRLFDHDGDPIDIAALTAMPTDFAGRQGFNTVFGEGVQAQRADSISCQFQYSNSARDVVPSVSGSGSTANADNMAAVHITGAVGSSTLTSKGAVRYRPGCECCAQFTSKYIGAQAGVQHMHGFLNTTNGATFGTKDGVFGAYLLSDTVETFYPSTAFSHDKLDGSGSGFELDPTKLNLYMVQFGWLGVAPIVFSVYCGSLLGWRVAHVIDSGNVAVQPHLGNPSLPLGVKVSRASGSGTAAAVHSASWRAGVVRGADVANAADRWFSTTVLDAAPAGSANVRYNLLTLRNKTTYQSKVNHVPHEISIVAFDNSTNRTLAVYGSKGSTITGGSAAADVSTADSTATIETGGTVTLGSQGPATVLHNGDGTRIDVRDTGIIVYPGESFTIEVVGGQNYTGTFSVSVRWRELF
jgi:hypothetical protein